MFAAAGWHGATAAVLQLGAEGSHSRRVCAPGGADRPRAGRLHQQGCLNAARQAWEEGSAQGAAASSSWKGWLRVTKHWGSAAMPQHTGDGGKQGLTCKNGPPDSVCVFVHWSGYGERWNRFVAAVKSFIAGQCQTGCKTSAVDVVYSDVSLCPTFLFLPHCCPRRSWKMKISTITQTPVESDSCPAPSPFLMVPRMQKPEAKWSPWAVSPSAENCCIYIELHSFHSKSNPMKLQ